jgi:hypothetical protein
LGFDHPDDRRPGGVDLGLRRPSTAGCVRAGYDQGYLVLNQRGSAVVAGVVNISLATLLTLSLLALSMAAFYALTIRDLAVAAASDSARFGAQPQQPYLLQRLDQALPLQANFQVNEQRGGELTQIRVNYKLPGLGLLGEFAGGVVSVAAATERI